MHIILRAAVILTVLLSVTLLPMKATTPAPSQQDTIAADADSDVLPHPRLFFTREELPLLRDRAATTHSAIWQSILEYVDSEVGTRPPSAAPVFGTEEQFRVFGSQVIPFAFACVISTEDKYCNLTRDYLLTYAQWQQWDEPGRRDLGMAHMLIGNALAYDWIHDYLSTDEQRIIRDSLSRWSHRMHQASADGYQTNWTNWWALSYIQNHFATNHAALGIAGLALLGDVPTQGATAGECTVVADSDVNLRWEPSTGRDRAAVLQAGVRVPINAQITGDDGYLWWRVDDERWVRSDVVRESGPCAAVPPPEWINPQRWIDRATAQLRTLTYILEGVEDGSWHEGLAYQNYMLTSLLAFLPNVERIQGVSLFPDTYLQNYVNWRLYNYLPDSIEPLMMFGDIEPWWGNAYHSQNILRYVAARYEDPQAQWLADMMTEDDGIGVGPYISPWVVMEFLHYDPDIPAEPPQAPPLSRKFFDLSGVIWRTGWENYDTLFGLKTGAPGGRFNYNSLLNREFPWDIACQEAGCTYNAGHSHADAGTFYLYSNGSWLAPEVAGLGNRETSFHNTLLINGAGQTYVADSGMMPRANMPIVDATLDAAVSTASFDYVETDVTNPYLGNVPSLQRYQRSALFVRPNYLIITDTLQVDGGFEADWISHALGEITVEDRWIRANGQSSQVLGIGVVTPETFEPRVLEADQSVHVNASWEGANGRFIHLLYPTDSTHWDERPSFEVLVDIPEEAGLRVQSGVAESWTVDIMYGFGEPSQIHDEGPYAHDLRVGVVRYADDMRLERLFAYGGTFITDEISGTTLVSNLNGNEAFEAVFSGSRVDVSGYVRSRISLYGLDIEQLSVNGVETPFERDGDWIVFGENNSVEATAEATETP